MTKDQIYDELSEMLAHEIKHGNHATWVDLNVELRLTAPYPDRYIISIWGEDDDDEEFLCVYILTPDRRELWHIESSSNQLDDHLREAVYAALNRFSDEPDCWTDKDLNKAFEVFCDIEIGFDGSIEQSFLHFEAGTYYEHVHDWFDKYYSEGIKGLLNPSDDHGDDYAGMGSNELKTAVTALIDAFIEVSQRHCYTHDQIADSLADIFTDYQLKWLGYREYAEDAVPDIVAVPAPSVEDQMVVDLLSDAVNTEDFDSLSSKESASSPEDIDDIDISLFDAIDPDGCCLSCNHLSNFASGTGKCKTCLSHGGTEDNYEGESSCEESQIDGNSRFNVGDKVRIKYLSDRNPHNGRIGTISWLNEYNVYQTKGLHEPVKKVQAQILYPDGTAEMVDDLYRKGSGVVSPIEKIQC